MNIRLPEKGPFLFLILFPFLVPAVQAAEVEWTEVVNATAEGSSLVKSGGCDGCEDAGARSQQQLDSGNVYVEFTVPDVTDTLLAGISSDNPGTSDEEIDFAVRIQEGNAEVREGGVYKADIEAADGDVFRITVEDNVVSYSRNGMTFHTSDQTPQYPLLVDVSLMSQEARIENVVAVPFESGQNTAQTAPSRQPLALRSAGAGPA